MLIHYTNIKIVLIYFVSKLSIKDMALNNILNNLRRGVNCCEIVNKLYRSTGYVE